MGEPTLVIATPEIRLHASGDLERLSSTGEHWIPIGWEPQLANAVAATLAARDELVRELGEELHERETVCDMWRSSVSEGIEERDRLRASIATLERELAEARQRDEDANGRLVGIDGGEPEDQLLCRDWKWVPEELNKLAATLAASDERIRELEAEAEKIRDTAVSIELVKVASVDLVQDADGRDHAVLSTSCGIGLHRQHNCDEEGCGCWHVIARPPLSVESRVALLDLRSAKDDAKRERDEARARIATLERELAEARQQRDDSDLCANTADEIIGKMQADCDAIAAALGRPVWTDETEFAQFIAWLAAARPKAEAAERRAELLRTCRGGGMGHSMAAMELAESDRAILAACPVVTMVEPAPAPARWRCEECGAVEVEGALGWYLMDKYRCHFRKVAGPGVASCGPCVPVTDAQPGGAVSDRDPRLDPRAGDVLRHKVGCRTREVSSVIRDSVSTWDVGVDGVRRSNVISTLKQWLRWAAGAEVLRVAVTDGNNPSSKEDGHSSLPSSKEDAP